MLRIGVDIGGTFTDFTVWDGDEAGYARVEAFKVPSTPPHFAEGVRQGIEQLMATGRLSVDDDALVVHGTTVSTNAVIERSGPPIALLTTAGFRDILGMARLRVENPVDMFSHRPPPLIPRSMVFEVDERLLADGSIDRPIALDQVLAAAEAAVAQRAVALGICFIHGFRNPVHEKAAGAILAERFPELDVVLSHEVWPQQSEYERASATLLNAYARRAMAGYVGELETFLRARLPRARLLVTKSNGGVMAAGEAMRMPIHTLLSGPAAGATAAAVLGNMLGEANLLTMDMGGTSTDISLIRDGRVTTSSEGRVGDFPLMMPVTAIEAIGAGGGSIAWMDGPVLKVGPRSAGAFPGPACYGRGGDLPTLSDAYLLCGYLSEEAPLASGLRLRRDLADRAMRPIAEALGSDTVKAARSCLEVATANMLANALPFIARIGLSPAELTLMIFGGAGGVHGPLMAEELGIRRIVVPRLSSVLCAFGCLVSDLLGDVVRTVHGDRIDTAGVIAAFADMRAEGSAWLSQQAAGMPASFDYVADIRYAGQSFDVATRLTPEAALEGRLPDIAALFHAEHERLFGHAHPGTEIEIITLRLRVRGALSAPTGNSDALTQPGPLQTGTRKAMFDGGWHEVPVYAWNGLPAGWHARGPAIIEQETATVVVPPAFTIALSRFGDLVLERTA